MKINQKSKTSKTVLRCSLQDANVISHSIHEGRPNNSSFTSVHPSGQTGEKTLNITKKILDDYKSELLNCSNIQSDIINKIVDQYLDSRTVCGSCKQNYDSYNFLSSCHHCSSSFCLFCQCDTTYVKYIPCPLSNCHSCASSLVCDNETSQTYCISCKDKLGINNNGTYKYMLFCHNVVYGLRGL